MVAARVQETRRCRSKPLIWPAMDYGSVCPICGMHSSEGPVEIVARGCPSCEANHAQAQGHYHADEADAAVSGGRLR